METTLKIEVTIKIKLKPFTTQLSILPSNKEISPMAKKMNPKM